METKYSNTQKSTLTSVYQRITYTILLTCVTFLSATAQNGAQNLGGAITQGLAGAGVTFDNISAQYTNQAGTAFMDGWGVDVSVDRRFNLEELTTLSVAAATSMDFGTVGFSVAQYGFDLYSEQKIGLSYARLLTKNIAIAGQFDVLGFKIDGFGNTYKFTAEFGLYTQMHKKLHLGAHVFNPAAIKLTENEELDSRVNVGLKYIPSNRLTLYGEVEKIIDRDTQIKLAGTYRVIDNLDINFGVNANIESFHFGFRYIAKDQINIAAAFTLNNNLLGNSPAFTGQYLSAK